MSQKNALVRSIKLRHKGRFFIDCREIIISVIIDVRPVPRAGQCHGWFEQSLGCTSDWLKRGSRSLWKAPGLHG